MPSEKPIMPSHPSPHLWVGLVACLLLVVGGLLWHSQGAAVFTALVSAALAWCF
jgi:hypothetical protein